MTMTRRLLNWLRCLAHGHAWVREEYHFHLIRLGATLEEIRARTRCKGACTRCGKSDCDWDRY